MPVSSAGVVPETMLDTFRTRAATYDRENRFFQEDFDDLFLPKSVTRICLCSPWDQILTEKQALKLFVIPAKADFRTPTWWPAGRIL